MRGEAGVCVVHARPESAWRTPSCGVSRVTLSFRGGGLEAHESLSTSPDTAASGRSPPTTCATTPWEVGRGGGGRKKTGACLRRACTTHKVWVSVSVRLRLRLRQTTRETQTAVRGVASVCVVHARPESAWSTLSCGVSRVTLSFRGGGLKAHESLSVSRHCGVRAPHP